MKIFISILAYLISNLSFGQVDKKSDILEIWTLFSTGNFINENAEKIVEKNWPFIIKGVAGDVFGDELIYSIEDHNNRVWKYLDSNGYTDSKEKFESDLLEEIKRIKKAIEITNSHKSVSDLFFNLLEKNLHRYEELNKLNNNEYQFKIYSYDINYLEEDAVLELKIITDLKSEKSRIVE
jgi:hypothetical protein